MVLREAHQSHFFQEGLQEPLENITGAIGKELFKSQGPILGIDENAGSHGWGHKLWNDFREHPIRTGIKLTMAAASLLAPQYFPVSAAMGVGMIVNAYSGG
jgi:hypothetical protein